MLRRAPFNDPDLPQHEVTVVLALRADSLGQVGAVLDDVLARARERDDVHVGRVEVVSPPHDRAVTLDTPAVNGAPPSRVIRTNGPRPVRKPGPKRRPIPENLRKAVERRQDDPDARGNTLRAIADQLGITPGRVKYAERCIRSEKETVRNSAQ
jgi:hypothetical protein